MSTEPTHNRLGDVVVRLDAGGGWFGLRSFFFAVAVRQDGGGDWLTIRR